MTQPRNAAPPDAVCAVCMFRHGTWQPIPGPWFCESCKRKIEEARRVR